MEQQWENYWKNMASAMDVLINKGMTARACWEFVDEHIERGFDPTQVLKMVETLRIYI